ncbi:MAG TPA: L-threonylcarbamoyladenylate synthase [Afifellaceae bacterium]|nr:L-threonylcarbamoyladenylate synthase [Afifellaceae bacterium]
MAARLLPLTDPPDPDVIRQACAILERGHLVAIPTETVYGLAGDATSGDAVARIFETKGRPRFNPLICHVSGMAMAEELAHFDDRAHRLAGRFWPGPLTLVLPRAEGCNVHPLTTAGLPTVALRMPKGPVQAVISAFGRPLAAPSANLSGRLSPTRAEHVAAQLGASIELILDAGPCPVGLESTIVALQPDRPARLLRPGGLSAGEIEAILDERLERPEPGAAIEAPGMMASHYAPRAGLRLRAGGVRPGEALLAFGPDLPDGKPVAVRNLSPRGDLREAAVNLFSYLAELDEVGVDKIAVMAIPDTPGTLGEAINDRLRRAALDPVSPGASDGAGTNRL